MCLWRGEGTVLFCSLRTGWEPASAGKNRGNIVGRKTRIRDKLIEKWRDARLRCKFLEKAGNVKLKEMQDIACAYEAQI